MWYEKAEKSGSPHACANIEALYESSSTLKKNIVTLVKYYQRAIERGDYWSKEKLEKLLDDSSISNHELNKIASLYEKGDGIKIDYNKALFFYKKAMKRGSQFSYRHIGFLYENGYGVNKDIIVAAKYYQQALEKGCIAAQEDLERVFSASNVDSLDLINISLMHYLGLGVKQDLDKSVKWLEKAMERGNGLAYRIMGKFYEVGGPNLGSDFYRSLSAAKVLSNPLLKLINTFIGSRAYKKIKNAKFLEINIEASVKYYQQAVEKNEEHAKEDIDKLYQESQLKMSAETAHAIGDMYHKAKGVEQNDEAALAWYTKSVEKGAHLAHVNMGLIYESKNIKEAVKCYEQAIKYAQEEDQEIAKNALENLLKNPDISAEVSNEIGLMYYLEYGYEVEKNYQEGFRWLEKAEKSGSAKACENLGFVYERGLGVTKNLILAAKYFQMAIERAYLRAEINLNHLLQYGDIKCNELNDIAHFYHNGEGVKQNYEKSFDLFTKSEKLGSNVACRNLGLYYEFALGSVKKDIVMAEKYYQKSIEQGHANAQTDLDRLYNSTLVFDEIIAIAALYYGTDGIKPDLEKVKKWCEKISEEDIKNNLIKIVNKQIKKEKERKFITENFKHANFNIDVVDHNGDTALHRAARESLLSTYVRLMLLGAKNSKDVVNKDMKKPHDYLNAKQVRKINNLQVYHATLNKNLNRSTPEILATHATTIINAHYDITQLLNTFNALYKIEQIRPLLDLAKLAALGLHDLSERSKFSQFAYDSDNDDDNPVNENQKFKINIDARSDPINGICHYGQDGQAGKRNWGLYGVTKNNIYVGGATHARRPRAAVLSTIVHELCHFVVDEVYKNINPYDKNDKANKERFEKIINDLQKRKDSLDIVLRMVFNDPKLDGYQPEQYHSDIIVRVAQMIVEYDNGLQRLKTQAPELLKYYEEVFLVAVEKHIDKLNERALSHWPLEFYTSTWSNQFHLNKPSCSEKFVNFSKNPNNLWCHSVISDSNGDENLEYPEGNFLN